MKKILFVIALMCTVLNVSAQDDAKWSIKVGVGLSGAAGSDSDGLKSAFSYKAGVGYEFGISENFAIEPALMLSNKAIKDEGIDGTLNRYFIELPIMAAYKIALGDETKLIINAGPVVSYGIFGNDIEWDDSYETTNVFDVCERFEAGVQAGVKVAFGNLSVGAEFNRAFTKAIKEAKVYSQSFGLTFGYSF